MAAFTTIAMAVGAAAAVGGTVMSYSAQKKQAKAQQKQQEVSNTRERRQAIRQAQLQRASMLASAQGSGAIGSSAVSGGESSLMSQLGSGLGFNSQMTGLSRDIARYASKAATFSGIAQLGGMAYNWGVNNGASWGSMFNRSPTSPAAAAPQQSIVSGYSAPPARPTPSLSAPAARVPTSSVGYGPR